MMAQAKSSASAQDQLIIAPATAKRASSDTERHGFAWSAVGHEIRTGFSRQTGFVR